MMRLKQTSFSTPIQVPYFDAHKQNVTVAFTSFSCRSIEPYVPFALGYLEMITSGIEAAPTAVILLVVC